MQTQIDNVFTMKPTL